MGDENASAAGGSMDLGGLQIPGTGENTGDNASAVAGSASEKTIKERKTRSDAGQPRGSRKATVTQGVPLIPPEAFAKLYSPDIWGKVLTSPADAIAAVTGSKIWEVTKEEREMLGATGSVAAQCFAISDPRYLALSLCLIGLIDVYATRAAMYYAEKKKQKKDEK
jgi:hypothetical protein